MLEHIEFSYDDLPGGLQAYLAAGISLLSFSVFLALCARMRARNDNHATTTIEEGSETNQSFLPRFLRDTAYRLQDIVTISDKQYYLLGSLQHWFAEEFYASTHAPRRANTFLQLPIAYEPISARFYSVWRDTTLRHSQSGSSMITSLDAEKRLPACSNILGWIDCGCDAQGRAIQFREYPNFINVHQLAMSLKKFQMKLGRELLIRDLLRQALIALAFLKRHDIFHGDICAQNFCLHWNEGVFTLKLTGFNVAQLVSGGTVRHWDCGDLRLFSWKRMQLHMHFSIEKAQPYAEKTRPPSFDGHREDLWALGLMAFWLLVGHPLPLPDISYLLAQNQRIVRRVSSADFLRAISDSIPHKFTAHPVMQVIRELLGLEADVIPDVFVMALNEETLQLPIYTEQQPATQVSARLLSFLAKSPVKQVTPKREFYSNGTFSHTA